MGEGDHGHKPRSQAEATSDLRSPTSSLVGASELPDSRGLSLPFHRVRICAAIAMSIGVMTSWQKHERDKTEGRHLSVTALVFRPVILSLL